MFCIFSPPVSYVVRTLSLPTNGFMRSKDPPPPKGGRLAAVAPPEPPEALLVLRPPWPRVKDSKMPWFNLSRSIASAGDPEVCSAALAEVAGAAAAASLPSFFALSSLYTLRQ